MIVARVGGPQTFHPRRHARGTSWGRCYFSSEEVPHLPSYLCAPVRLRPGATIFLQLENMIRRHTGSTSDTLGTAASPWRAGIDTSDPAAGITVRSVSCRFIRYPSLPGGVDRPPGAHPHECPATGGGRSPRDSGQRFLPFHAASTIARGSRSPILRAPP